MSGRCPIYLTPSGAFTADPVQNTTVSRCSLSAGHEPSPHHWPTVGEQEPKKKNEAEPARELTKRDWIALHTLIFELGAIVIEQGVDSLPPPLQGLLVPPPPPPFQPDTIMGRKWKGTPDPDANLVESVDE